MYAIRPDRTAIWIPWGLAESLGVSRGDTLDEAQWEGVQELLANRRLAEAKRKEK